MNSTVLTASQSEKDIASTKEKKIKTYTLDETLPAFQTNQECGELDWGKPQGKEI